MTRFARAKGSKACNDKTPEAGTPWEVMKDQLLEAKKQNEEAKKREQMEKQRIENYENFLKEQKVQKRSATWCDFPESEVVSKKKKSDDESEFTSKNKNKLKKKENKKSLNGNIKENTLTTSPAKDNIAKNGDHIAGGHENLSKKLGKNKKKVSDVSNISVSNSLKDSNNSTHSEGNSDNINTNLNKKKKKKKKLHENKAKLNDTTGSNDTDNNKSESNICELTTEAEPSQIAANSSNGKPKTKKKKKNKKEKDVATSTVSSGNVSSKDDNEKQKVVQTSQKKKSKKLVDGKPARRKAIDDKSFKLIINGEEVELVRCEGFPIMKKDAERIEDLKKNMIKKGIPKSEVQRTIKLERRRAEKALARLKRNVCYNCRKGGHNLSDCPDLKSKIPSVEAAEGICFKCGSTEHRQFECKVQRDKEYRFATCFICKEPGHISRQCPDNPKGLYPNGGCCKLCGDVTHLRKDCPTVNDKKEEKSIKLQTLDSTDNLEDINQSHSAPVISSSSKKPKKIKF